MSADEGWEPKIKPKRTVFIKSDVQLLIECIKKYGHVLNNRKTGGITPAMKTKAWEDILATYNTYQTGGTKTVKELKKKYKNMKCLAKKGLVQNAKTMDEGSAALATQDNFDFSLVPNVKMEDSLDCDSMTGGDERLKEASAVADEELENFQTQDYLHSSKKLRMSEIEKDLTTFGAESLKLDIESRKLDIENKQLDTEAKRLEIEHKKFHLEKEKLEIENLKLETECKKFDIENKKLDIELKKLMIQKAELELNRKIEK